MDYKDYYQILGVERSATADQIKRNYRRLARKFHPDVSKEDDAETRFKELGEAYEVLRDAEKRAAYDQLGSRFRAGEEFHPPPDWNAGFEHGAAPGDYRSHRHSDFFESLFGAAGRGAAPGRQSADHHARILIELRDAYLGASRNITLQVPEIDSAGRMHLREHGLKVVIPPGVRAGQLIRLAGQGSPLAGQASRGDLFLEIAFRHDPRYRVELRDVYVDVAVAPWEAALGASITLPTPSGTIELKLPAGSQNGRKLRLRGRGIPGDPPGDLYAELRVILPAADNEADRAAYRQLAEHFAAFSTRNGQEAHA